MSDAADKRKPLIERVAQMLGRGNFLDGQGRGGLPELTQQDIAATLGLIQQKHGAIVPMAMETFYGSTLVHEPALREAWEQRSGTPANLHDRAIFRFGAALAARKLAGQKYTQADFAGYAKLLACHRTAIEGATRRAEAWYCELLNIGTSAFPAKIGARLTQTGICA